MAFSELGSPYYAVLKRCLDIVVAIGLLIGTLPLTIAVFALAVWNRQSPFFVQSREGFHRKKFRIVKFRTIAKIRPKIEYTVGGRWIRALSIDELPQVINVLRGEMSLVGPRPHPIILNRKYRKLVPDYDRRHDVTPGITGLAQISGARGPVRTTDDMQGRLSLDLTYVHQRSILRDICIMARTPLCGILPPIVKQVRTIVIVRRRSTGSVIP